MSEMKQIKKWLEDNHIEYAEKIINQYRKEFAIQIMLEKDCVWINGFGEEMHFDKYIMIRNYLHGGYCCTETTDYATYKTIIQNGKQKRIIEAIESRMGKKNEIN